MEEFDVLFDAYMKWLKSLRYNLITEIGSIFVILLEEWTTSEAFKTVDT